MKQTLFLVLVLALALAACKKDKKTADAGTATIDNITYRSSTYYILGFTFSTGQKVSTDETPGPDIAVYVNADNPNVAPRLYLAANTLKPAFYKAGEYADSTAAINAFENLKTFSASLWLDLADPILPNQIWIYRSGGEETYSKFRIIKTVIDKRTVLGQTVDFGQITFEWVHQPDGTLTFP
jgi:hypothetical protein